MGRRRRLSPEDRRLWDQVAASARPLRPAAAPELPDEPARPAPLPPPPLPVVAPSAPRAAVARAPAAAPAPPQMDARRLDKLRRGRMVPEARLDLHGMTSERAHAMLTDFVLSTHAAGLRLLLVITGKGQPDDSPHQPRRHGILRHSLPHWLAAPPLNSRILQVQEAHTRHGGGGAFYVYLRRHR